MTRLSVRREGNTYRIIAKGHAGTPEECAAVSTIMTMAGQWAKSSPAAKLLLLRLESGDAEVVFRGGAKCRAVCEMVTVGFALLEAQDPVNIRFDEPENL